MLTPLTMNIYTRVSNRLPHTIYFNKDCPMFSGNTTTTTTTSYTSQASISSMGSNDSEYCPTPSSDNTLQYGPIAIRLCRKSAPTLETGRRSKHLVLVGEEAARREKRRERNREAAKKLKEKRLLIEEELNQKLKDLEDQHSDLQDFLYHLKERKQLLQNEVNSTLLDPIEKLLTNEHSDMPLFFEQYSDDLDSFDEAIERILNSDCHASFQSVLRD